MKNDILERVNNLIGTENGDLIRPVGSAPNLAVKNWSNLGVGPGIMRMPIRPALRQSPQQNFATASYGMVRMPQPHVAPQVKRKKSFKSSLNASNSIGGGGSNKRVMFSGVSDNESASESQDDITPNPHANTLPILKVRTITKNLVQNIASITNIT